MTEKEKQKAINSLISLKELLESNELTENDREQLQASVEILKRLVQ